MPLQNFVPDPLINEAEGNESESEENVPKQILAGLHNKTYFKGVSSLLLNPDKHIQNGEGFGRFAEQVLKRCNVKPTSFTSFLKAGEGKFVGNPESCVKDTYIRLKQSLSTFKPMNTLKSMSTLKSMNTLKSTNSVHSVNSLVSINSNNSI